MEVASCPECARRNAVILELQARMAALEADAAKRQQLEKRLQAEIDRLTQRLAQYEPEVQREKNPPGTAADSSPKQYSMAAEEKRRRGRRRRKKKSPGRRRTKLKFAEAKHVEPVYPDGVPPQECVLCRERAVWRLLDGKAVLVGYRIFAKPGGKEPPIPGVTPRCEYGIEILVTLAFLIYVIGISFDKACAVLGFFCQLPLSKSQVDALLRQLARHWQKEFDALCNLIAYAAVVYMDETGWKIGSEGCSLWTFLSEHCRLFVFGCRKDAATLDRFLPPDVFKGIGVSDDAAVYRDRFDQAQKCWAHLLRKAIKLALLYPRKRTYKRFLDGLLALYYDAKRMAADKRLGAEGRQRRIDELEDRLIALCAPHCRWPNPDMKPHERDFANLMKELTERTMDEELFTFVLHPEVEPTNNFAEREQRQAATDRKTGRTSKSETGAQRRSILVSVLESLRANLPSFTLASVVAEVKRWMEEGISLFGERWQAIKETQPTLATDSS